MEVVLKAALSKLEEFHHVFGAYLQTLTLGSPAQSRGVCPLDTQPLLLAACRRKRGVRTALRMCPLGTYLRIPWIRL